MLVWLFCTTELTEIRHHRCIILIWCDSWCLNRSFCCVDSVVIWSDKLYFYFFTLHVCFDCFCCYIVYYIVYWFVSPLWQICYVFFWNNQLLFLVLHLSLVLLGLNLSSSHIWWRWPAFHSWMWSEIFPSSLHKSCLPFYLLLPWSWTIGSLFLFLVVGLCIVVFL